MAEDAQVRVKLVYDAAAAQASSAIVGDSLKGIGKEAGETKGAMEGMGSSGSLAAGAMGGAVVLFGEKAFEAFHRAIESVNEFVAEGFRAAAEVEEQTKSLTGTLTMIGGAGRSFQELHGYAAALHDELEQTGIAAGVSTDAMQDAFAGIAARSNKSSEAVQALTEQMAIAGKAIPGGLSALSGGFENFEMGVYRARNPLVQLIAATGTLEGNAKSVAAQLQKMSPEEAMKKAEIAIGTMSQRMKDAPASFGELTQSLKDIKSNMFEAMGTPMLASLMPPLNFLKTEIIAHKEQIEGFITGVGQKVGEGIEVVTKITEAVYETAKNDWGEISSQFSDVFEDARSIFNYIYENEDTFAKTFGDIFHDALSVTREMVTLFQEAEEAMIEIARNTPGLHDIAFSSDKEKARKETLELATDPYAAVGNGAKIEDLKKKYTEASMELGQTYAEAGQEFENIYARHAETVKAAHAVDAAAVTGDIATVAAAYNQAGTMHHEAMQKYIATAIAGNQGLIDALTAGGTQLIEGGFAPLMKMIEDAKGGNILSGLKSAMSPKLDLKSAGANVNFNHNVFQIKQDFRKDDPDKIALIFRRDVVRNAVNRVQARTSTPFGL